MNVICNLIETIIQDINILINSTSIILIIIGGLMMWANSPENSSTINGGNPSTDSDALERNVQRKNKLVKLGISFITIGGILQLINLFV